MSQTVVAEQGKAYEGQRVDLGNTDIHSFLAEGSAIGFGKFVVLGTDAETQAILPAVSADITDAKKVAGVVVRSLTLENPLSGNAGEHAEKDMMSVIRKGRIYVKMEEAFDPTDAVYVRYAAGGNGVGSCGVSTGTSERALLANARILNSGSADELAVIDLSLV